MSNVLFYWWRPDLTFLDLDPQKVIFPSHNANAWAQGDKRTASAGSHVGKLLSIRFEGIGGIASRVYSFLQNLEITMQDIEGLLAMMANGQNVSDAACHWVLSNKAKWEKWVPVKTACAPGYGLIDRSLQYVSARATAVDCGLCVPGHFSELVVDNLGRTRRCTACEAGHFQQQSGETLCSKCQIGSFLANRGQSECVLCPLGGFANSSAMSFCHRCGAGAEWTTNRLVKVAGQDR